MPNPFSGLHVSDDEDDVPQVAPVKKAAPAKKTALAPTQPAAVAVEKSNKAKGTTYYRPARQGSEEAFSATSKETRVPPHHDTQPRRDPKNERQSHDPRTNNARGAKRAGAGKGNWGKAEDLNVAEATEEASVPSTPAEPTVEAAAGDSATTDVAADATPAEPEGPKQLTLEEYKKLRSSATKVAPTKIRQANEGADQSQWSPLEKPATPAAQAVATAEHEDHRKTQRSAQKQYVEVTFRPFSSFESGSGERSSGERGRGRGRGRGDSRGGRGGREGTAKEGTPAAEGAVATPAAEGVATPVAAQTENQGRSEGGRGRGRGGDRGGRGRGNGRGRGGSSHGAGGVPNVLSESDFPKL